MDKFIDLVIAGPDFSGTTTQINDLVSHFKSNNFRVRDLRGTEVDALFHADRFSDINYEYDSLKDFLDDPDTTQNSKNIFLEEVYDLLSGRNNRSDLLLGSMIKNDCSTYIDPASADVWVMEEPPRRGAGQICRTIEQNRSKYGSQLDGLSAALAHQAYRTDEFLRFRKPLRDAGKIIIRSRSEESACYQVYDEKNLRSGIRLNEYLMLPGHKIAFANPPTHIFVVCGPIDWDKDEYLKLKSERTGNRILDDHEKNYSYQLLVNQRYATDWINNLYRQGCSMYQSREPEIIRFDIYNDKETTRLSMRDKIEEILRNFQNR
jgi:thymidylate kinase